MLTRRTSERARTGDLQVRSLIRMSNAKPESAQSYRDFDRFHSASIEFDRQLTPEVTPALTRVPAARHSSVRSPPPRSPVLGRGFQAPGWVSEFTLAGGQRLHPEVHPARAHAHQPQGYPAERPMLTEVGRRYPRMGCPSRPTQHRTPRFDGHACNADVEPRALPRRVDALRRLRAMCPLRALLIATPSCPVGGHHVCRRPGDGHDPCRDE